MLKNSTEPTEPLFIVLIEPSLSFVNKKLFFVLGPVFQRILAHLLLEEKQDRIVEKATLFVMVSTLTMVLLV